jgi:glutamate/tyrosine decarboxylase-like PLP-dependent enzyme
MDINTSLEDVVSVLQGILSAPDLPTSTNTNVTSVELANTGKFSTDANGDSSPSASNSSNLASQRVLPAKIPKLKAASIQEAGLLSSHPDEPLGTLQTLAEHLSAEILPFLNRQSLSPNYYGFVTGGATPAALLGDLLAGIYDQNVQVHLPGDTIVTAVEVHALNLLVQLFRLPEDDWQIGGSGPGGGTFTTGATASNILGLALGREYVIRRALEKQGIADAASLSVGESGLAELMALAGARKLQVLSTLPHSSVVKAAGVLGIGRKNVISLATADDPLQIDFEKLETEVKKEGVLNILAISSGEVNTGRFATNSLEQMVKLRQICSEHGIWIHVDGAFGLFGRLFSSEDPEYSEIVRGVAGLELADSITGDCHKLLNVPYDCGIFFTKHKNLSEDVFRNGNAAYLTSGLSGGDDIQSPLNVGIENSRRFRALPVYSTIKAYGSEGYLDMLKRQVGLARRVTQWLLNDDRFEVLPISSSDTEILAKTFIIVLFRIRNENLRKDFVKSINATGKMFVSGTVWDGQPAARIAVSNWRVDIDRDSGLIQEVLDQVARG